MNSVPEVTIHIDNQAFAAEKGMTILQAAQRHNIYIPTLCAHKDLTPFGGCRMCIVEVDSMRGLPTSCTTPVEEGMVIHTQSAQIRAVRQEILKLILSEHTSSCLICDEREECRLYSTTIRKAGVTTGCRYCSNDNRCELQDVVEHAGLQEIGYAVQYRDLPVEKEDPFFDRDYNICILCGRCVRMCQDVRTAGTLTFVQRGQHTVIGTAFHRNHIEAGCEFCGACVSVCPTGALAEKANKWDGAAERETITTCPFCGIGCQMRLQVKGDRVLGSLPAEDPLINRGQLCVKGRFCVAETVNGSQRLGRPYRMEGAVKAILSWDEAADLAAAHLAACAPEEFGLFISPNCSNEDLYVAQKFVRAAMASHRIDNSARLFYGAGFNAYLRLFRRSVPLAEIEKAPVILCIGLDARYGRSVAGVELRRAIRRGARVVTIHPRQHSLANVSHLWLQPAPEEALDLLRKLAGLAGAGKSLSTAFRPGGSLDANIAAAALLLRDASAPVFLIGSEFLSCHDAPEILEAVWQLAETANAGVLPLPAQNNLLGSILMGTFAEVLPGGITAADTERIRLLSEKWGTQVRAGVSSWNAPTMSPDERLKVLYLVGERVPGARSLSEFIIHQDLYPPDSRQDADLVLPAAAFSEADATCINGEGRIQKFAKAVNPPGEALPDWKILSLIARKLHVAGFEYEDVSDIQREIASVVPELEGCDGASRQERRLALRLDLPGIRSFGHAAAAQQEGIPMMLILGVAEHQYRGTSLAARVEGAAAIFPEDTVEISPGDAAKAGIANGDEIILRCGEFERAFPVRCDKDQPEGTLHGVVRPGQIPYPNPLSVTMRKRYVQSR